jgi:hypothetical protein
MYFGFWIADFGLPDGSLPRAGLPADPLFGQVTVKTDENIFVSHRRAAHS